MFSRRWTSQRIVADYRSYSIGCLGKAVLHVPVRIRVPVANRFLEECQCTRKPGNAFFLKPKVQMSNVMKVMFGITSQLRRSALSIPANIVEGYARKSKKELAQFISIALGSHAETEYLFDFSRRLGHHKGASAKIEGLIAEAGKLLWGFYRTL